MINVQSSIDTLMSGYFQSAKTSFMSKIVTVFSSMSVLWFGGHIFEKADFGLFMLALAYVTLAALILAAPFGNILLYHVSRLEGAEGGDEEGLGSLMTARSLSWAMFYGALVVGGTVACATLLEQLFDKPGISHWFVYLAPMILMDALRRILASWHRARQEVEISIKYNEIWPNALKAITLLGAYLFAPSVEGVAIALNISMLVPLIMVFARSPIVPNIGGRVFTPWDIQYAGKNLITYVLNQQARGIDILFVGMFASPLIVADYAIASRLAQFLLIGKQALSQLFAPRLGALLGKKDKHQAAAESTLIRRVSVAVAIMGAIGVLLLGEWVSGWFCSTCYNTYPILLILSAAMIMNTLFGAAEDYMYMAGHAGWNLFLSMFSAAVMVILCALLIPILGGVGAALAVLLSFVVRGVWMVWVIQKLDDMKLLTWQHMSTSIFIAGFLVIYGMSL